MATARKWYVRYTDHTGKERTEAVSPNRKLAERRKIEIEEREEKIRHGVLPAGAVGQGGAALWPLFERWEEAIRDKGASAKQAAQSRHRAEATFREAGISRPADITAEDVVAALAHFRRAGVPRREGDRRKPKPLSARTSNHFLRACRAFVGWLIDIKVMQADPLARVRQLNPDGRETFTRRALDAGELERLVAAATIRRSRCDLAGVDRGMVYYVAFYTGFRLNELAVLVPEDFRLGQSPCVVLRSRHTKNKKEARQYLPTHAAERLRVYLADKPAGQPVWTAPNFFAGLKASAVLRRDLAAAGIPFETPDGRVDFHALRGSYITALAVAGVPLPVVQRAARHSDPRLTARHYIRLTDANMADEMQRMKPPA